MAFDCPTGPADIVDVPARDVNGLTAALLEMVADEQLRRRCGDAAVETAQEYTMAAVGPKWDEMMHALLQQRS